MVCLCQDRIDGVRGGVFEPRRACYFGKAYNVIEQKAKFGQRRAEGHCNLGFAVDLGNGLAKRVVTGNDMVRCYLTLPLLQPLRSVTK